MRFSLTPPPVVTPEDLRRHVSGTYKSLRNSLGLISFGFPLFLWIGGELWYRIPLQGSISAYYYAPCDGNQSGEAPLRTWFVGILFTLGLFLYLYKGFSNKENVLLNVAGFGGLGVALFPMGHTCGATSGWVPIAHTVSALTAFFCLALVAWFCTKQSLPLLPNDERRAFYQWRYKVISVCMGAFPAAAAAIVWFFGQNYVVFAVEAAGLIAFGAYWLTKGQEFAESDAEMRALDETATLSTEPVVDRAAGVNKVPGLSELAALPKLKPSPPPAQPQTAR